MSINETKVKQFHFLAWALLGHLEEKFPEHEKKLSKVRFEFSNKLTRAAGNARPHTGLIRFSAQIWSIDSNTEDEFKNTVLHEIAHVIAGAGHGHDAVWKTIAKQIGCTAERCHQLEIPKRKEREPWPCSVCGNPIMLGPIQINKARRGYSYRHGGCVSQDIFQRGN